jgi:DNA-binding LytR/AlgR family response regulator
MFLDIQTPELTGLDVARHARGQAYVAFITAHEQYAVTAFERGAVDSMLKPFSTSCVAPTGNRLKERLNGAPADLG